MTNFSAFSDSEQEFLLDFFDSELTPGVPIILGLRLEFEQLTLDISPVTDVNPAPAHALAG